VVDIGRTVAVIGNSVASRRIIFVNVEICYEVIIVESLEILPLICPAVFIVEYLSVELFDLTGRSVGRFSLSIVYLYDFSVLD
jgi:hypothetical protein